MRTVTDLQSEAKSVDSGTLFYVYYFGLSEEERNFAKELLISRSWKINSNKTLWYQRNSQVKVSGEGFEIADVNIFDALKWTSQEKRNFRIEYSQFSSN
ncbi:unnamed protein product [[Candida] boidinii]|uniref:Unnamed protein product n=1 Tax=Candida boidinii TaxID=5477 RepID=A0A9W6TAM4_CANBO|nr:unnamed protein product [[Candida] boidinii]